MMKKFTFKMLAISMFVFMGLYSIGQTTFTTTFNVDMTGVEVFDPVTDEIFMSGNFAGWSEPGSDVTYKMEPTDEDPMVYTLTLAIDSGEVQYKYFRVIGGVSSWNNGEWTGNDNRVIYLYQNELVFNNVWANRPVIVKFMVDMSEASPFNPETDAVYIAGDLGSGWREPGTISNYMMTPVDETMTYAIYLSVYKGVHEYKYFRVIDGQHSWDNGEWTAGANRSVTVNDTMTISDTTFVNNVWGTTGIFNIPNEFTYNMYPNPANDFIYIANTADVNRVDVYDVTGKMVRTAVLNRDQDFSMNVSNLNNGVYIINVTNDKGVQTSKFVKR